MSNAFANDRFSFIFLSFFFHFFFLFVEKMQEFILSYEKCILLNWIVYVRPDMVHFFFTCRAYMRTVALQATGINYPYHETYAELWAIVLSAYREMHIFLVFCRTIFFILFFQTIRTNRMVNGWNTDVCFFLLCFIFRSLSHRYASASVVVQLRQNIHWKLSKNHFCCFHYYWLPRENDPENDCLKILWQNAV